MLDFFKKKTPRKVPMDIVAGFGKLPLYPEFIKYRTTYPAVRALDEWYQKAYTQLNKQLGLQAKDQFEKMPPCYFLLTQRQHSTPLVGAVHASYDSSSRRYPFVTCRLLNHLVAKEFLAATPLLYQAYFQAAGDFLLQDWQHKSISDAENSISRLAQENYEFNKRHALEKVLANLKILTLNDFFKAFDGPLFDPQHYIARLIGKLRYFQQALPQRQARGIRFPLPGKYMFTAVVFYLQLLDELFDLKQFHWEAFWQAGTAQHQANLLVYFDVLPSEYWQQFVVQSVLALDILDLLSMDKKPLTIPSSVDLRLSLLDAVPCFVKHSRDSVFL